MRPLPGEEAHVLLHSIDAHFNHSQITYSGVVEWISGEGVYTSFKEQSQETADKTSLTISPLTPSTVYTFRVAMVTPQGQKGEGVEVTVNTTREVGGNILHLHSIHALTIIVCVHRQTGLLPDTNSKHKRL